MRHDVIIAARLAGCALGAFALYACQTPPHDNQGGTTSVAPAVTGQNSSGSTSAAPDNPKPPQTDVSEQKTGPK